MRNFLVLFFVLLTQLAFGQIHTPVKWDFKTKHISGDQFEITSTATIDPGWTIYSQYLESDDGPVATSFNYDEGAHYELVGKNKEAETNRKEGFDKLFEMNVIKYSKKATFTQVVKVKDYSKNVTGYVNYMTCDATKCLPPTDEDFDFKFEKKGAGTGTGAIEKPKTETKVVDTKPTPPKPETKVEEVKSTVKDNINATASSAGTAIADAGTKVKEKVESKTKTETKTKAETKKKVEEKAEKIEKKPAPKKGILKPVEWSNSIKKVAGDQYELTFVAAIDKGWNIYSQHMDGDDGPVPTSFNFDESKAAEVVGDTKETGSNFKNAFDKMFKMNLVKYKDDATFTQLIKVKDASTPITGFFEFMTCDETQCLPPAEVDFVFMPDSGKTLIGDDAMAFIQANDSSGGINNVATSGANATAVTANIEGNVINQEIASIRSSYVTPIGDCGEEENAKGQNLVWTFLFGFIGGLLALLTPCVFPMIPLTVSFFTKGSKDRASGIKNGLLYGLSIIVIYVTLGLLITGLFGATALNELSTDAVANVLFFLIFIAFAFSFFGFYEITLPSFLANKSDSMAEKGGLIGTFFMAFTLAIVSFSCTGPIIGTALVQSATNTFGPFMVMLGFSSALALPFGLFAAFPAWLNSLPRSGGWMNSVKVVLGFLELALAFKFLSVADMTMGWGILGYEIFMGLWILIFGAMTAYLFGLFKFPHDSPVKKLSPMRGLFAVASLALTIYLCTGFTINKDTGSYNSLGLMSGLAPPTNYNYFLTKNESDATIKDRYKSFTKCANDLDCFKDYYEGVSYAKEVNKPILLDFTGHGCVNCRKTEEHIWVEKEVWNKINDDYVLISLYVDERKKLEQELVSKSTKKKIRNVGNKWADFQIVNFEQNSQPLYVMMTPNEQVIAKPRGYKPDVEGYVDFLNCGLDTYNNHKSKLGSK